MLKMLSNTVHASQANLSCQRNDNNNVLREEKISYVYNVSNENIRWLDPHIAAVTADVVLAVEKNTGRMAIANGTCVSFCIF